MAPQIKIAANIANLAVGREDIALLIHVTEVAIEEWKRMQLDGLIAEVKKVS